MTYEWSFYGNAVGNLELREYLWTIAIRRIRKRTINAPIRGRHSQMYEF